MEDWLRTFGEATDDLTNHPTGFMITTNQKSLVVSILSAGTFVGALTGAFTGDFLGRKWGIVFACLVFSIGVAMQTASTALPLFIVGRVIAGWVLDRSQQLFLCTNQNGKSNYLMISQSINPLFFLSNSEGCKCGLKGYVNFPIWSIALY